MCLFETLKDATMEGIGKVAGPDKIDDAVDRRRAGQKEADQLPFGSRIRQERPAGIAQAEVIAAQIEVAFVRRRVHRQPPAPRSSMFSQNCSPCSQDAFSNSSATLPRGNEWRFASTSSNSACGPSTETLKTEVS